MSSDFKFTVEQERTYGGEGGGLPYTFLEIEKSALILEKRTCNFVHPWLESSIQNVILRVSRRKSSKIFRCRAFFTCVFDKYWSKCPNFTKPLLPWKILANFTGKHLRWSLFLIKLRPATLSKRDSNTGVFLWNLSKFQEHPFLQNASGGCFWVSKNWFMRK